MNTRLHAALKQRVLNGVGRLVQLVFADHILPEWLTVQSKLCRPSRCMPLPVCRPHSAGSAAAWRWTTFAWLGRRHDGERPCDGERP